MKHFHTFVKSIFDIHSQSTHKYTLHILSHTHYPYCSWPSFALCVSVGAMCEREYVVCVGVCLCAAEFYACILIRCENVQPYNTNPNGVYFSHLFVLLVDTKAEAYSL